MYNYRNDLRKQEIANELSAYQLLLAAFCGLELATAEGIYQITVHSQRQVITVQVPELLGATIAAELTESLEDRVIAAENRLNSVIEEAGKDTAHDREGRAARAATAHPKPAQD
jgi:hypothetical protein